jgi:predicted deacetylase
MRYVILRDDDVNALTPPEHLDLLYRPFLDRGLPVNLSIIPEVALATRMGNGKPEGYLLNRNGEARATVPISENRRLVRYLRDNPGFHIAQHGCEHDWLEFDRTSRAEIARRLDHGARILVEAGFARPQTFVPPYDRISRAGLLEVAARFQVLSTGWYEWRRLPCSWWPQYAFKKMRHASHWKIGRTLLLSHPGCLLSYQRPVQSMFDAILAALNSRRLTVLVTHWWEYFRDGRPDESLIGVLHQTANYLHRQAEFRVISFETAASGQIPLQ